MRTAEQNLQLLREIEANRAFMIELYRQNPALLESAESRIKALFMPIPERPVRADPGHNGSFS